MVPHRGHWTKHFQGYRKGCAARALLLIPPDASSGQAVLRMVQPFKGWTRWNGPSGSEHTDFLSLLGLFYPLTSNRFFSTLYSNSAEENHKEITCTLFYMFICFHAQHIKGLDKKCYVTFTLSKLVKTLE